MPSTRPTRILILGGGFGGLYTAIELEKRLDGDPGVEVTLVNRDNFILFTPMLHEVAASDLDLTHIVNPIRKLLKRTVFFQGTVERIDLPGRTVHVRHGEEDHPHALAFDHLVLALGSVTNDYGLPGLDRALTMKTLGDAIALRNRLIAHLEEADFECCAHVRGPLLTLVVAGGGFAGVETAAAAHDFLEDALPHYARLAQGDVRVVMVHSGAHLLPELGEDLGRYAARDLARRGMEVVLGARVTAFGPRGVELSNGQTIAARTLVWTAGTAAHPLCRDLPCGLERGRVRVTEELESADWPGLWAVGDCAAIPDGRGGFHPPTAQHALREGKALARNLVATIRGGRRTRFRFGGLGQLAAIGRRTGVAKILGLKFSGFTAWWMWRSIYLAKLPRLEKKLRVMFDWTLDLLFSKDLVQFSTSAAPVERGAAGRTAVESAPAAPGPDPAARYGAGAASNGAACALPAAGGRASGAGS